MNNNQFNINKTIDVYTNFWKGIFDIMSSNTIMKNGQIVDVNSNAMTQLFDIVNQFKLEMDNLHMTPVAMATIMETLYGLLNDIPYVSEFNQNNSKQIRSKFSDYINGKTSYEDFKKSLNEMINHCNSLFVKANHTEDDKNYITGYMQVKGVFFGLFSYFLTKESFLFTSSGDGKLNQIKEALSNGQSPKISMFGTDMYPFYNKRIVELMMEVESKSLGSNEGPFNGCFGLLNEFRDEYFNEFKNGMHIYEKIGFGKSIGLWQDVESCRSKIAIVFNNVVSEEQTEMYTKLVALQKQLTNMEVSKMLGLSVSDNEISALKNEIKSLKI